LTLSGLFSICQTITPDDPMNKRPATRLIVIFPYGI
jgi:hypothetical protein